MVETVVSVIVFDDDSNFNNLFYQDQDSKKIFEAFPEMLFVDAVRKFNEYRMSLYSILVADEIRESQIVALFVLSRKNDKSLCHMMVIFKKEKKNFEKIERFMTDEDFNERNVFKVKFPNTKLLLCHFHICRSFRKEITVKKK